MNNKPELSGSTLKIMALIFMLIDHTAAIVFPPVLARYGITSFGNISMEYMQGLVAAGSIGWLYVLYQIMRRILGRLAFPIFAFQIAEGFLHTSNFRRYALRLLAFACLSEIPFDLMYASTAFNPFHQNVMFTLLLGLLAIHGLDRASRARPA